MKNLHLPGICFKHIAMIFSAFLFSINIFAQSDSSENKLTDTLFAENDFFLSDKPLRFKLISDFKKLQKEKAQRKYQPAELIYFHGDTGQITWQVKVKPRGKNRLENCYYPPLKIAFKNTEAAQKMSFNSLKMVVKCQDLPKYQNYLLKEFVCYKLYNILSDTCFKVRLVDFIYEDIGKKNPEQMKMYAFLIEDDKMLAGRLNMKLLKHENLTQRNISPFHIMRLAMFQFMIGNFDWAVPTQQNLQVLESVQKKTKYYVAPYDFDYCGLVGAEYAVPNEILGIRDVYERIYLGECMPEGLFAPLKQLFESKKQEFYNIINDFEYLDETQKKQMIKYLEEFYFILNHKDFYSKYIRKTCKEIK